MMSVRANWKIALQQAREQVCNMVGGHVWITGDDEKIICSRCHIHFTDIINEPDEEAEPE